MEADLFDITVVIDKFMKASEGSEDDVVMDCYLEAFREILKYFFEDFSQVLKF